MAISREQEFKTCLTKTAFLAILNHFEFDPAFSQMNTYYDTADGAVKAARLGLRIRQFADHAEQTLKVPNDSQHRDLQEITDPLTSMEAQNLIERGELKPGQVTQALATRHIDPASVHPQTQAKTTRRLAHLPAGLLTLDQTFYIDQTSDFELEMEYQNLDEAKKFYDNLLQNFHIKKQPVINKVQRAYEHVHDSQAK
ncbi:MULTISPECIES: CYTH domain-containing protein [Lacticaseibacillus]|uniref:CYTH domain-containing protein n=1 Tax=Lacticaseibacillus TaxID=2759736 RepID=UPI00063DB846|nr:MULTISPECIES: CYTH domain-containing protein [Lacticaseibacillus]KLI74924.1 adenylate cyclase [Lacticaseibacillus casei]